MYILLRDLYKYFWIYTKLGQVLYYYMTEKLTRLFAILLFSKLVLLTDLTHHWISVWQMPSKYLIHSGVTYCVGFDWIAIPKQFWTAAMSNFNSYISRDIRMCFYHVTYVFRVNVPTFIFCLFTILLKIGFHLNKVSFSWFCNKQVLNS